MTQIPVPPRRRPKSLAEEVVESLSGQIRDGVFHPGEKLPTESAIMQDQGVSRTVVREAISRLQAAGLVETRHGVGTFVLSAPPEGGLHLHTANVLTVLDVIAILELRISLETEAAWLAASRRTDAQLRALRQALDRAQADAAQRADNAVNADLAFHLQVAQATGNRYFHDILEKLGNSLIPRSRLNSAELAHADQASYLAVVNREHEDIYHAIARRDPEAARAAMRMHLTNSRERLRRAQQEDNASAQG